MAELFDILTYDFVKDNSVDTPALADIPETYTTIAEVAPAATAAGTYEYGFSLTAELSAINKSIYMQFSTDGGSTYYELRTEHRDASDEYPITYTFPVVKGSDGAIPNFIMQMRKEDVATPTLNCKFIDLWIMRVK